MPEQIPPEVLQQLQQQQQFTPQQINESMSMSLMNRLPSDLIQEMLKPVDVLEEIEHKLRNEKWTIRGGRGVWHKPEGTRALVNEEGINNILTLVSPLTSRAVILSYYESGEIEVRLKKILYDLCDLLRANYRKWEIQKNNLSTITNIIWMLIEASMKRALYGGEKDFLGKTTERRELIGEKGKEKGGWIGKIFS